MGLLMDSTEASLLGEVLLLLLLLLLRPDASSVLGRLDSGGLHTGSLEGDGLSKKRKGSCLLLVRSVINTTYNKQ